MMNEDNVLFEENLQQDETLPEESSDLPVENTPADESLQQDDASQDAPIEEISVDMESAEEAVEDESIVKDESVEAVESIEETESVEGDESEQEASPEEAEQDENVETEEGAADDAAPTATDTPEESEPTDEPILPAPAPYHERYYLKYGEGKRTVPMDLAGTKAFLQNIGFDGGELKQAREGKDFAETFKNAEGGDGNQMRCSYCGTEVSGVDFYRLPDGRIRCTSCSNSVVKTKAEVEEICQRVIDNLDNFFRATIDVPIAIEVLDERKLKKRIGVPLGTKDDQSILVLGVAINKKKKYSMLLENGAPRISLIATFAHELTHIWQYTHWDNKKDFEKCPKDKKLLIYEGMAKWVEIQYLYLIGETTVAKREEYITRNREDEYGIGFCLYEDNYPLSREAMTCEETPFTLDRYPID